MRRILALVMALVAAPTLVGCSHSADQPSAVSSSSVSSSATTAPTTAGPSSSAGAPSSSATSTAAASASTGRTPLPLASIDPGTPQAVGRFTWTRRNLVSEGGGTTTITVSVGSLTSTPTGTRLTFWLNAANAPATLQVLQTSYPEDYPLLTDPRTKTVYHVTTWHSAAGVYCVCSEGSWLTASTVKPMDAAYATLPTDLTQVQVSMPGETASVTVPVTR